MVKEDNEIMKVGVCANPHSMSTPPGEAGIIFVLIINLGI
jgi:hypothetical protein